MKILLPNRIISDFSGYSQLIDIYNLLKESKSDKITLDFKNTTWFEANLAAVFGAIVELLREENKSFDIINLDNRIKDVLCRNKFLSEFGHSNTIDPKNTVITYQKYKPNEDDKFKRYIKDELLSKPDFPKHSVRLGKKINESIFEIYENARTHGKCKHIHSCGQYYPNKYPKRLDITIVDMGQTIKSNVNQYLNSSKDGADAIQWAIQYGNTTKTGSISGGLGLDIIFEFIKLNEGKVQIVSSDGYWEYRGKETQSHIFKNYFPGTIVNIEFNLNDSSIYKLKEEEDVSLENIF